MKRNLEMIPLKPNFSTKKIIGFDIETYTLNNQQVFLFGGIYHSTYEYYTTPTLLIQRMLSKEFKNCIFSATNLAFDFLLTFFNTPFFNKCDIITAGTRIIQVKYKLENKKGSIYFYDTLNYAPYSVKKWGELLKIPKKSIKFTNQISQKFIDYNKQDCLISKKALEYIQEGIIKLNGKLKSTIAQCSLDIFRRSFQTEKWVQEEQILNRNIKPFIREGYYGGRTEVYNREIQKNINYYDINSLYPAVMLKEYPVPSTVKIIDEPTLKNILDYEGVSRCHIITPYNIKFPVLPYRDKKLLFPKGRFTGVYNHNELRLAIDKGYSLIPIEQIIYTKTFKPFEKFVNTIYGLRQTDKDFNLFYKLILNSTYGKFGQNIKKSTEYKQFSQMSTEEQIYHSTVSDSDIIDDIVIKETETENNSVFSFPIISSYVASYGRMELYKYIEKYNPIYVDTDSIFTHHTLETSTELGEMKLEMKIDTAQFLKPKMYRINENVKIKGVRKPKLNNWDSLFKNKKIRRKKFSLFKESFRRKIPIYSNIYINKQISIIDDKRIWLSDSHSEPISIIDEKIKFTKEIII